MTTPIDEYYTKENVVYRQGGYLVATFSGSQTRSAVVAAREYARWCNVQYAKFKQEEIHNEEDQRS